MSAETWRISLDDRLIDHETGVDLDGYVWGVKWHRLYPGAKLLPESDATRRWSKTLGIDFHEVLMETNAHNLTLLFSELQLRQTPRRRPLGQAGPASATRPCAATPVLCPGEARHRLAVVTKSRIVMTVHHLMFCIHAPCTTSGECLRMAAVRRGKRPVVGPRGARGWPAGKGGKHR